MPQWGCWCSSAPSPCPRSPWGFLACPECMNLIKKVIMDSLRREVDQCRAGGWHPCTLMHTPATGSPSASGPWLSAARWNLCQVHDLAEWCDNITCGPSLALLLRPLFIRKAELCRCQARVESLKIHEWRCQYPLVPEAIHQISTAHGAHVHKRDSIALDGPSPYCTVAAYSCSPIHCTRWPIRAGNRRVWYQCGTIQMQTCLYSLTMHFVLYQPVTLTSKQYSFLYAMAPAQDHTVPSTSSKCRGRHGSPTSKAPTKVTKLQAEPIEVSPVYVMVTVDSDELKLLECNICRTKDLLFEQDAGMKEPGHCLLFCERSMDDSPQPSPSQMLAELYESLHQVFFAPWPKPFVGEKPANIPFPPVPIAPKLKCKKTMAVCPSSRPRPLGTSEADPTLPEYLTSDTDSDSVMEDE